MCGSAANSIFFLFAVDTGFAITSFAFQGVFGTGSSEFDDEGYVRTGYDSQDEALGMCRNLFGVDFEFEFYDTGSYEVFGAYVCGTDDSTDDQTDDDEQLCSFFHARG